MQLDQSRPSPPGSPSPSLLSRLHAQSARAPKHARSPNSTPAFPEGPLSPHPSARPRSGFGIRSDSTADQRPGKVPKLEGTQSPSQSAKAAAESSPKMSSKGKSAVRPRASSFGLADSRGGKAAKQTKQTQKQTQRQKGAPARVFTEPLHDMEYIQQTYMAKPLKPEWQANPKSPLNNYMQQRYGKVVEIELAEGQVGDVRRIWRASIQIPNGDETIVAYGDSQNKKEAQQLAALCAIYQLDKLGLLDKKAVAAAKTAAFSPTEVTLQDGSVVDYERGRQFIDYYCRRFKFGKPDIAYSHGKSKAGRDAWEAVMTINDRRIGLASGTSKKTAMQSCYVDVTQYLESCDPELWKSFIADAKTGRDLGMAPPVFFQVYEELEDQLQDLCGDIKRSVLYRNRPKPGSAVVAPDQAGAAVGAPRYVVPSRRQVNEEMLSAKSLALQERRKAYLENPKMEKMRNTRASLPVYTKSESLLQHIRDNEVTICMAATGSGKTTQIPQLILDEWIDKGEGAKCNILCTQPRRLAAISVADRVAAERGETSGKGSVGYQVRFEAKLPENNGSITFCTTGIFLKRMQSALQEGEAQHGRSLDDVTHVVVDEVHERDVDTDLLLVVLKRLIADRKAKQKPIKVILMSATIDPTLFQQYFPDEKGQPASVIDIPGRSFPVKKHMLEDFVPKLIESSDRQTGWVFREPSVQNYLTQEMGAWGNAGNTSWSTPRIDERPIKDDLDLPYPLLAYTVSHVLRSSSDGHVLVFLPGWDDIMGVQKCLLDNSRPLGLNFSDTSKFSIHLLHSTIPVAEQQVIFEPPPQGVRRIILATNIAETSVTIPDVVYVVDTAKIKEQRYDPERRISSLVSAWVGSSNLNQRAGRAGRHRSGEYFGILGRRRAEQLAPHQTVEMKRVDLSNIVMHIKALNFPRMSIAEVLAAAIEPPTPDRVEAAMYSLQMVGALDEQENLTSLGRVLLQLPVEATMGRLVLFGSFFRCLDQALTLAALMTNRDPFLSPMHLKQEAFRVKNSFSPEEFRSDSLAALRAYNKWWAMQSRGEYASANRFCMDNFLSKPTLLMIQKIKAQLLQSLYDIGIIDVSIGEPVGTTAPRMRRGHDLSIPAQLNENAESLPLLAALITIALQPNFAVRAGDIKYRTAQDKMVFIHPSSVNCRKRDGMESLENGFAALPTEKQILAFSEKRQNMSVAASAGSAQKFIVTTTRLDPLTYMLFGAHRVVVTERGLACDEWLPIIGRPEVLDDVERLKVLMDACMLRVFEGITMSKTRRDMRGAPVMRREEREEESADEDDDVRKDYSLTPTEIKEFNIFSRDIVRILNSYSKFRLANQSQHNSRPATPVDTPRWGAGRLPSSGGSHSGYSTPYMNHAALGNFNSRPSTPSRFSRRF